MKYITLSIFFLLITSINIHGQCWELVFEDSLLRIPADIHFIDENHGWVVGRDSLFVKTSDGGDTWEQVLFPPANIVGLYYVHFLNTLKGWAIENKDNIFHTENGGQSWEEITINTLDTFPFPVYRGVTGLQFINPDTGWIAMHEKGLYQTVDGGESWQYNTELGLAHEILGIQFISGAKGWLLGRSNDPSAVGIK